ncbi:uncharacterized protein LOC122863020 isoform X2 [Xyrichtys novacula]|uniref:Uncharacterized protein LOC122863020 isoform X2 n=1 Tax=Xyrichtys novacula TaxID=13765 RepID=A0AAV1GVR8_XYRNO|nr:uncharacterized protein LOC122863020 isoform X2 [Xyrichtys novacula]
MVPASWRKFFVNLSGRTDGAHSSLVEKLKLIGQTEVFSLEESDYVLLFCPVTTKAKTDISEALKSVPGNKPVVLVVLHHTLNHNYSVDKSEKLVNNQNVHLVVDCLFHDGRLLDCDRNVSAWSEITKLLAICTTQVKPGCKIVNTESSDKGVARNSGHPKMMSLLTQTLLEEFSVVISLCFCPKVGDQ